MTARELINTLQRLVSKFGNLPICGGTLHDDTPPLRVIVIDAGGCETSDPALAVSFFVEGGSWAR